MSDRSTWKRIVKATWGGRDAHGAVPFDKKDAWRQGYDEAMRQVRHALDDEAKPLDRR